MVVEASENVAVQEVSALQSKNQVEKYVKNNLLKVDIARTDSLSEMKKKVSECL